MTPEQEVPGGWMAAARSSVAGALWPAILTGRAASLAALTVQLEASQWLTAAELEALQFRQLEALIAHAFLHVPYYRERLSRAGIVPEAVLTPEAWRRLPVLERPEVQEQGLALRSTALPESHGRTQETSTSGSTGRKVVVLKSDLANAFHQALTLRAGAWGGWDPRGVEAAIRQFPVGVAEYPDGERRANWGAPHALLCETGPAFVLNATASVARQAEWLSRVQPHYLTTYAGVVPELLDECARAGYRLTRLKYVRTVAECLDPAVRDRCREQWGAAVQDTYSAQDAGYLALQCPAHDCYHVQSEDTLLEVLDERGEPCAAGRPGRVVVTPLHNFAMPLLRYALGDYAEAGPPCPCGRGLPVLTQILGRVRNILVLPNGERKWPRLGKLPIRDALPARQYQMIQTGSSSLELRLVAARRGTASEEAWLTAKVAEWIGYPFEVKYTYLDEIPRGPGGKFEDFRSELAMATGR